MTDPHDPHSLPPPGDLEGSGQATGDAETSPALLAMQAAMRAAAEAAEARARAKQAEREHRKAAGALTPDEEDYQVLAATALDPEALDMPAARPAIELGEAEDLDALVAELSRALPELPGDEVHGDLVIKRGEDQVRAWYELAAEASLPARLREVPGPVDVKGLLTALLVEIGDVKRTNAMLMEQLARIEEKVDRTHRSMRQPRF